MTIKKTQASRTDWKGVAEDRAKALAEQREVIERMQERAHEQAERNSQLRTAIQINAKTISELTALSSQAEGRTRDADMEADRAKRQARFWQGVASRNVADILYRRR